LLNVSRHTIVAPLHKIPAAIQHLRDAGFFKMAQRPKNFLDDRTDDGYQGINTNWRNPKTSIEAGPAGP
jgi:hypothetical protein